MSAGKSRFHCGQACKVAVEALTKGWREKFSFSPRYPQPPEGGTQRKLRVDAPLGVLGVRDGKMFIPILTMAHLQFHLMVITQHQKRQKLVFIILLEIK